MFGDVFPARTKACKRTDDYCCNDKPPNVSGIFSHFSSNILSNVGLIENKCAAPKTIKTLSCFCKLL